LSQIFISYRRQDQSHAAGRLFGELASLIGADRIFMDVDAIPLGVDFVEVLEQKVATCEVLLAVIGSGWLNATDDVGCRRLDRSDDFVRIEIASALRRNIPMVPVLMDGAQMPEAKDLPDDLKPLARRQATVLSHRGFRKDVEHLVRKLALRLPDQSKSSRSGTPAFPLLTNARIGIDGTIDKLSPTEQDVIAALDELASGLSEFVIFDRGINCIQSANKKHRDDRIVLPTTFRVECRINLSPRHFEHYEVLNEGMNSGEDFENIDRVKQLFLAWMNSQQLPLNATLVNISQELSDATSKSGNAVPDTATSIGLSGDPIPDMSIVELFLHINPFVLDRTQSDDAPWETAGLAIRDKLSLKHLRIWGRQVLEGMSKTYAAGPVLQEIEPRYWQSADFTYTFFHGDAGKAPQVYIKDGSHLPCYTDLQLNRAQVEAIWPKPNLRLLLARLRREGVAIRNDSCRLELEDADFNAWSLEVGKWRERTAYVIEQIDAADAEWFRILDIVPEPREPLLMPRKKHEGKHFAAHRQHDFRLAKLEQLIQRYSARGAVAVYA